MRYLQTSCNNYNEHGKKGSFSHLNELGQAQMVDVGHKECTNRQAKAEGKIYVGREILQLIEDKAMSKGDVLSVSRIAGIMGAKQTSALIPLCHQIPLTSVKVDIFACKSSHSLIVKSDVKTSNYHTGVEMESLMAVSITLLTIYDMCKSVSKQMEISAIQLISKTK